MKLKIGENIRRFRRDADLTQQQFAEQMGVTCQSVSRWENGETYPDTELLPAIADYFHVSVDRLMGVPDAEKQKQAHETFDALRRACMRQEIDTGEVVSLLREIRRNYLETPEAWRIWLGNDRCFRMPEVLPEVRLTAEAYLALHPMDANVIETMAWVEDEEHLEAFLYKHSTGYDTSYRALLFMRYWRRGNAEKLEPERKYRFAQTMDWLFDKRTLYGIRASREVEDAATRFQSELLDSIRENRKDDEPDMWVEIRLDLAIRRASIAARNGNAKGALFELESVASLLETTMRIREPQALGTSCRWLDGMSWTAEECWNSPSNNPDGPLERAVSVYTEVSGRKGRKIRIHFVIYPSLYYDRIANLNGKECLQDLPEYRAVLSRVEALMQRKPRA